MITQRMMFLVRSFNEKLLGYRKQFARVGPADSDPVSTYTLCPAISTDLGPDGVNARPPSGPRWPCAGPIIAAMSLSQNQKKYLRRLGHGLQPVVLVGQQGLTEAVARETDAALAAHELLKVKARVGDRSLREQVLSDLAGKTGAELVQTIGNVGLLYRQNRELQKILIPDS
jgi:RNA-binding protein